MKAAIPILALIATACTTQYYVSPGVAINIAGSHADFTDAVAASTLVKKIQSHEYKKWERDIQKIRNAYARVIKVLEDKEAVQFTVAFFKTLSLSEDLDRQIFELSNGHQDLPNMDTLKFFYTAEKELNHMIAILSRFANSSNLEVKYCAVEAERYFHYQRDFFIAIRDVDYRHLKTYDIPFGIPPEVLKANAKLLEQREQMSKELISFYEKLADANLADS